MLENHSADNVLGMLPQVSPARRRDFDGLPVNRFGTPIASNPSNAQTVPRPASGYVRSYPAPDDCASSGLTQNWNSSHAQYNGGRNNGFVTNAASPTPMIYLTEEQLPVTYALAGHFPVNDRYFCSMLGQTLPNRRYYFSGTSSGQVNDDDSSVLVPASQRHDLRPARCRRRLVAGLLRQRADAGGLLPQFPRQPDPGGAVRQERSLLHRRLRRHAPLGLLRRGELQLSVRGEPTGHRLRGELPAQRGPGVHEQPAMGQAGDLRHLRRARRLLRPCPAARRRSSRRHRARI